jgi:CMP/dCMP kinase
MEQKIKNIIAIDGTAASGKGTLARNLAKILNFAHLDTGAVYRLAALRVVDLNEDPLQSAAHTRDNFELNQTLRPDLRRDDVGVMTSKISAMPEVRAILEDIQKNFAYHPPNGFQGAILDGRDIGTHITPDAPLKFYVISRPEIRATRRLKELQSAGIKANYEAVLKDMIERDARDQNREFRPLRPAEDSILLDTSDLSTTEVLEKALAYVKEMLALN